jgi:hypothetical protein
MKFTSKNIENFDCNFCDFKCCKKGDWSRHLTTSKHQIRTKWCKIEPPYKNTCENCNTTYNSKSGLWYHKKKCKIIEQKEFVENSEEMKEIDISNSSNDNITKLFLESIKQNQELQKQMFELLKDNIGEHHNTINSNNKTTNNQFNLNLFLNETCKDAMNINEFIDYVTVNLDDFENFGKVGYPKALSEIIVRNLNELDIKIRPIHCSDLKREVLHVKHDGVWHSDDSQKFIKRSITYVANKNIRQRPLWQDENPESKNCLTTTYERFNNICLASLGPATDEEEATFLKKITSTIAREVVIDKKKKY